MEAMMADENEAERALQRDLVRRGYDAISYAYRDDAGRSNPKQPGESTDPHAGWIAELAALLRPRARILDLGCGAGVPATKLLAARNFDVLGLAPPCRSRAPASWSREPLSSKSTW